MATGARCRDESLRLDLVHLAIRSGILGHIQWKPSAELLVLSDPELHGIGIASMRIRMMLREFVQSGGMLEPRVETRQEYRQESDDPTYWYRAIIPMKELPNGLFVEVILIDEDERQPWIEIVSAHRQES
jgi:hypothetical protein